MVGTGKPMRTKTESVYRVMQSVPPLNQHVSGSMPLYHSQFKLKANSTFLAKNNKMHTFFFLKSAFIVFPTGAWKAFVQWINVQLLQPSPAAFSPYLQTGCLFESCRACE